MFINRVFFRRKRLSVALRYSGLVFVLSGLTACSSLRSPEVPPPGKVTLKMNAKFNRENYSIVKKVYVYPPLKINEKGVLLEQLSYTEDAQGNLHWHAPSPEAAGIQAVIEERLSKRGFQVVPFQEILAPHNGYSIIVFNAYYTPILSKDDGRQVKVLFTRLSGVLLPANLDLEKKQDRISQEALVRFNSSDEAVAAIKTSFQQSVEHIGETAQWVETYSLFKGQLDEKGVSQ